MRRLVPRASCLDRASAQPTALTSLCTEEALSGSARPARATAPHPTRTASASASCCIDASLRLPRELSLALFLSSSSSGLHGALSGKEWVGARVGWDRALPVARRSQQDALALRMQRNVCSMGLGSVLLLLAACGARAQSACRGMDAEMATIAVSCCGEGGQYCRGTSGIPDVCNAECRPVFTGFYTRCRDDWAAMGQPEMFNEFLRSCKRPRSQSFA